MGSTSEYRGLGLNGGEYINDTAAHSGNFFAIQATEDTVLAAQTSNITNLDDIYVKCKMQPRCLLGLYYTEIFQASL